MNYLSEETGIDTETIPNVSTLFVIDALRKANLGQDIKAIVNSIEQEKPSPLQTKDKMSRTSLCSCLQLYNREGRGKAT